MSLHSWSCSPLPGAARQNWEEGKARQLYVGENRKLLFGRSNSERKRLRQRRARELQVRVREVWGRVLEYCHP